MIDSTEYLYSLKLYLEESLKILCDSLHVPIPPLIICNKRYGSADGFYESNIGVDIIYIDLKSSDYIGTLLHEFAHYIGNDEVGAYEFVTKYRHKVQENLNRNVMT